MIENAAGAAVEPHHHERGIQVERWPSEIPLLVLVTLASVGLWIAFAVTIVGIAYALLIGAFLFFAHLTFITHLVGSAVKLGPQQFPELHARVVELAYRAGLAKPPDAYLIQAGGSLNALATKLFRGRMIVLFTDLLDACGDDHRARDMVIGHEIGHLRSRHLDWMLLLAPGRMVPFLGSAYSRACEYTCDRWGAALCGDSAAAARGLAILAAGRDHGPRVNLQAFVDQRRDLDTGWLTLGRWLSSYPPLSARIAAIEPAAVPGSYSATRGPLRAALIVGALVAVPALTGAGAATYWVTKIRPLRAGQSASLVSDEAFAVARDEAYDDFQAIAEVVREHFRETGEVIGHYERLRAVWVERRGDLEIPADPFDGLGYGIAVLGQGALEITSSGRDGASGTADDIRFRVVYDEDAPGLQPMPASLPAGKR